MKTATKKSNSEKEAVGNLNNFWVPIPALRTELAKISKDGYTHYPAGELILIMKKLIEEVRDG